MKTAAILILPASAGLVSSMIAPIHRWPSPNLSPLASTLNGITFEGEIQINKQAFYVILDTGSSDLWRNFTLQTCTKRQVQSTSNTSQTKRLECSIAPE